jgi:hypothetical protein
MPRRNIPGEVPPDFKWCFGCSNAQPKQRFAVDRSTRDGRQYACLRCMADKERSRARIKRAMGSTYLRHTDPL